MSRPLPARFAAAWRPRAQGRVLCWVFAVLAGLGLAWADESRSASAEAQQVVWRMASALTAAPAARMPAARATMQAEVAAEARPAPAAAFRPCPPACAVQGRGPPAA